jgi:hypothetical protein
MAKTPARKSVTRTVVSNTNLETTSQPELSTLDGDMYHFVLSHAVRTIQVATQDSSAALRQSLLGYFVTVAHEHLHGRFPTTTLLCSKTGTTHAGLRKALQHLEDADLLERARIKFPDERSQVFWQISKAAIARARSAARSRPR